ncbi:hypothetical protein ALO_21124 [Acetonema longum DSM 6540]|uniref:Uncharacterized protein n=1 Tax=Acetonema longum DSM 6540 TaxID=1009370 RepID=F7NQ24_9FIRM|nr:hypothetical protein ALO_21124 [Acetonema longum DSM 6540]
MLGNHQAAIAGLEGGGQMVGAKSPPLRFLPTCVIDRLQYLLMHLVLDLRLLGLLIIHPKVDGQIAYREYHESVLSDQYMLPPIPESLIGDVCQNVSIALEPISNQDHDK